MTVVATKPRPASTLDAPARALIAEHVRHVLTLLGVGGATVECRMNAATPEQLSVVIEAGKAGRDLIGTRGTHLAALQHLLRMMLRRQLGTTPVVVDVNGYWAWREEEVRRYALAALAQAKQTGRTVALRPMSAAERRLLHAALAPYPEVRTESVGVEPNRRVVVRPVFIT